ncbi:MAG: PD-(D/E)XK nuclease family protein [Crocinitomicaceae bacterium]|nr:PD-(D/E)XK nuclease family protein [Crocinitomicaceae bacterium]MBK8926215.1 PD-(D/E)XK nuclease family protein [Crocinitomicaceae bacterium]
MNNYLKNITDKIFLISEKSIDDISIILPGKRAAVYIQKYLAEHHTKPLFLPEILTIDEWITSYSEKRILSQHELMFSFFDVHKQLSPSTNESFNEFAKWATNLLADFDEVDRNLIDPKAIFRDLRNIKELEQWSFSDSELSKGQQQFMHLWDSLPKYYEKLHHTLNANGETTRGMVYRNLANEIDHINFHRKYFLFAGFNALSASEEKIIRHLVKYQLAEFIPDVDEFYFLNEGHEAGYFYRKIYNSWNSKPTLSSFFKDVPKEITVIESAQQTGQARIAGKILHSLSKIQGHDMSKTAIVLADESLLIPFLKYIPDELGNVNVTMGYPIKLTHFKSLLDQIFELQFSFSKFSNSKLYHRNLLRILDHAFIRAMIKKQEKVQEIEEEIKAKNKVFIDWIEVGQTLPELEPLSNVFKYWSDCVNDGFKAMRELVSCLYHHFKKISSAHLELEILYHFMVAVKKFEQIHVKYPHELDLKTFRKIMFQFWQQDSLSFLGNPIEGLQIMGILETRLIDFDTLIILGMNEGQMPQVGISNSMIPYDLRNFHGLPTEEERQAIYAHHFYRLLQRAKTVYMTYNSSADGIGNSEKSRYIEQMKNELITLPGYMYHEYTYSSEDSGANINMPQYASVNSVHEKLDHYFTNKGLSPSALNKLISCPLDFYYRYILEMKEDSGVEENIESSTFGTKIHKVLENIFRKHFLETGQPLSAKILKDEKKNLSSYLWNEYVLENADEPGKVLFEAEELKYGQNKLSYEISLGFLERFIDRQIIEIEQSNDPIFIQHLEHHLETTIEIDTVLGKKSIRLIGNADRIDRINQTTRIIDYKSGKCDREKVNFPDNYLDQDQMFKLFEGSKRSYARQLLMYAVLFENNGSVRTPFSAGIISMINLSSWLQFVKSTSAEDGIISHEMLKLFKDELGRQIALLYDPNFIFSHHADSAFCEHCNK